jgi:seryl-tRNA synthetase
MCETFSGLPHGLSWNVEGFTGLRGPLHALAEAIDRRFVRLASRFAAQPQAFGPLLPVGDLRKIDYFSAFPHLVMFPAAADSEEDNLREFARRNGADATGPLIAPRSAAIPAVLAPAACYAVYISMEGTDASPLPRAVTVRSPCFRSERVFEPLVRQQCFTMREIIHFGDIASVSAFLQEAREGVLEIAVQWGLSPAVQVATDPFFDPTRSPKYLHAKLFPSKHEVVDCGIAIASLNNHRNYFGKAYGITAGGIPVHTGCVAFGIERWIAAILRTHGPEPAGWPTGLVPPEEIAA